MADQSFATVEDYYYFTGQGVPSLTTAERLALESLLRRATQIIIRRVRLARVNYNSDGIPTTDSIAAAFRDATSAQAQVFDEKGDATGVGGQWDSVGMAGVTFSKRATANSTTTAATERIAPESLEILMNAGIFSPRVSH